MGHHGTKIVMTGASIAVGIPDEVWLELALARFVALAIGRSLRFR